MNWDLKFKQFACATIVMLTGYYFVCCGRSEIEVFNQTGQPISDIHYMRGCLLYRTVRSLAPGQSAKFDPHSLSDLSRVAYTDQVGKYHRVAFKDAVGAWLPPQQITVRFLPANKISWSSSRFVGNHLVRDDDFANDLNP